MEVPGSDRLSARILCFDLTTGGWSFVMEITMHGYFWPPREGKSMWLLFYFGGPCLDRCAGFCERSCKAELGVLPATPINLHAKPSSKHQGNIFIHPFSCNSNPGGKRRTLLLL